MILRGVSLGAALTFGASAGCSLFVESALSDKPSEGASTQGGTSGSAQSANTGNAGAGGSLTCTGCGAPDCCDGQCVDLSTSKDHCGACGHACVNGRTCVEGKCSPTWVPMKTTGAPEPRERAAAVWTSAGMFVWGGKGAEGELADGAIYDPATGAWTKVSDEGAPSARTRAVAVWTGSSVIVWGGGPDAQPGALASGGRYDPAKDEWLSMNEPAAGRHGPAAVWTGSHMLVWGGTSGMMFDESAALYDPTSDTWSYASEAGAPGPRNGAASAWSGEELLVFGGRSFAVPAMNDGYAYNPKADTWTTFASKDAAEPRYNAFAAWMNGELMVWGGRNDKNGDIDTAGRYNPSTSTWSSVATNGPPPKRSAPAGQTGWAAWTGDRALFLGGLAGNMPKLDGAKYDPLGDAWEPPLPNWPSGKAHTFGAAVWSGSEFFLWSGFDKGALVEEGESIQP